MSLLGEKQKYWNPEGPQSNMFDYIVVGAGSAGCVVARRLLENTDARILVLEAGESGEGISSIEDPMRWLENIGSNHDYLYHYEPTPLVNNRTIYVPRGKVLGGSGSINAMVWARGNRNDYDGWADAGNLGWDYESVLPLFKKIEDWQNGETGFHGSGGPIHIQTPNKLHWLDRAMIDAGISFGMPYLSDTNGPSPEGVGPMSMNIYHQARSGPFEGYLKPVMHSKNLTILTGAKVLQLNLTGNRCTGVNFLYKDEIITVNALHEVILTAGAIDTPRILMLSGIGDEDELSKLNIKAKVNLKGVGKNLQDHPLVSVLYEAREPIGEKTYNLGGSNLYWKSSSKTTKCDLMLIPVQLPIASVEIERRYTIPENAFSVFVTLIDVKSRGYLKMTSSAHNAPLEIQPNLMQDTNDFEAFIRAVELCMDLASEPALEKVIKRWIAPVSRANRQEIIEFLRDACSTYFHPVGTCAMGNGVEAVVNNRLEVHGVLGLRIADASIMPQITTANTNAPTLMIAEFASELILGKR